MTQQEPLLCTVQETATLLGFSERTVWDLIRSGKLASVSPPSAHGSGKRVMRRVKRTEIDAFIERNSAQAP